MTIHKTILTFAADPNDACSFYRGEAVIARLPDFNFQRLPSTVTWSSFLGGDLLFMQRPYHDKHVQIAELAKPQIPLWVDYDDLLLDVPPANPAFTNYSQESIQRNILTLLSLADLVTVTTSELAAQLSPYANRIIIIPNAYNDYLLPVNQPEEPPSKTVFWRGSACHQADLLAFAPAIIKASRVFSSWQFVFMGSPPWQLADEMDATFVRGADIFPYFQSIRHLHAAIHIVPLRDNAFNRCKSNIAWIEGSSAGSVVLAPDWPEWQTETCLNYTSVEDFGATLQHLMANIPEGPAHVSWDTIREQRLLSRVNDLRWQALEELLRD